MKRSVSALRRQSNRAGKPVRSLKLERLESRAMLAASVEPIVNLNKSNPWESISELTEVGRQVYFAASEPGANTQDLWTTDGTTAGTKRLASLGPKSDKVRLLTNVGGTLYFVGFDLAHGDELWKSNGTVAGTVLVKDVRVGPENSKLSESGTARFDGSLNPRVITRVGGALFFTATAPGLGQELWKTDGTREGTRFVRDIRVGPSSSGVRSIVDADGVAYFIADNGVHGEELWRSDGTSRGTALVRDIRSGLDPVTSLPRSSMPENLRPLNGVVFFTADDGIRGRELWRTNGTGGGATLVRDIAPGASGSNPGRFVIRGNQLIFPASSSIGRELWRVSAAAPVLVIGALAPSYREGARATPIAVDAVLTDTDTPILAGGRLDVSFASRMLASDRLSLASRLGVTTINQLVLVNDIVVGSLLTDAVTGRLSVSLNQNASVAAVQLIVRAIAFSSDSQNPSTSPRRIKLVITDGEGATLPGTDLLSES